jgi:hypothetical protein
MLLFRKPRPKNATTIIFPNAYEDGRRKKIKWTMYLQDNVSLKASEELTQTYAKTSHGGTHTHRARYVSDVHEFAR